MKKIIMLTCALASVCAFAGGVLRTGAFELKKADTAGSQATVVQLDNQGTLGVPASFIYVVDSVATNTYTIKLEAIDLGVAKEIAKVVTTNTSVSARLNIDASNSVPTGTFRVSVAKSGTNGVARVKWGVVLN